LSITVVGSKFFSKELAQELFFKGKSTSEKVLPGEIVQHFAKNATATSATMKSQLSKPSITVSVYLGRYRDWLFQGVFLAEDLGLARIIRYHLVLFFFTVLRESY
jgi:hypothetical protein